MSTRREEYLIIGCKFDEEFTNNVINDDHVDKYMYPSKGSKQWILLDGMNGDYTFFGIITQLSDGDDMGSYDIIEFSPVTQDQINEISVKFKEVFPGIEMPEIKMYFVPHYC
jgi:hypothetical protein